MNDRADELRERIEVLRTDGIIVGGERPMLDAVDALAVLDALLFELEAVQDALYWQTVPRPGGGSA